MRKLRVASALAITVLSVGGWSITALADTAQQSQSQQQSIYTSQTQTGSSDSSGTANQSQNSSTSSAGSQTTSGSGTTDTEPTSQQTPQSTSTTTAATQLNQSSGGAETSQQQGFYDKLTTDKQSLGQTETTTTTTSTNSKQRQTSNLDAGSKVSQNSASLTIGSSTQVMETQSVSKNGKVLSQSTTSGGNTSASDPNQNIVGYAVFDTSGNLLSDHFANVGNLMESNFVRHYDVFTPNTPATVVIAAVNSQGQIVPNPGNIVLYPTTNNPDGLFRNDQGYIDSIELPAGSTGVDIQYVNWGPGSFDNLDLSIVNPHPPIVRQPPVEAVSQSQTGSVGGVNASEGQFSVVKSDTNFSAGLANQSAGLGQSSNSTQNQSIQSGSQGVKQGEVFSIDATQNTSNQTQSSPAVNESATQNQAASGQNIQLSQTQSVTATNPTINVTVQQSGSATSNSAQLSQSLGVNSPSSSNTTGGTTVVVQFGSGGPTQQYYAPTGGPVTVSESQSVNTSQSTNVNQSVDIYYQGGSIHVANPTPTP